MYLCNLPFQELATLLERDLILPALTPQPALLRHWSDNVNYDEPIINYCYKYSREKTSSKDDLLTDIKKYKKQNTVYLPTVKKKDI